VFPEITFLWSGDVPPIVVPDVKTSTPRPFGTALVPSGAIPKKQPSILLPLPPATVIPTPPTTKKGFC
jgi:hypothetical protein